MITKKQLALNLVNSFNLNFSYHQIDSFFNKNELIQLSLSDFDNLLVSNTWISGGIYGNNCYDYLNLQVESEYEIDFLNNLFLFLKNININLDYELLKEKVQKDVFEGEKDYYFNYYEYTTSYIKLSDLYEILT